MWKATNTIAVPLRPISPPNFRPNCVYDDAMQLTDQWLSNICVVA